MLSKSKAKIICRGPATEPESVDDSHHVHGIAPPGHKEKKEHPGLLESGSFTHQEL